MKRKLYGILIVVLVALVAPTALQGQHYVGVRGGYGGGIARFYPDTYAPRQNSKMVIGFWNGAVTWKYYNSGNYSEGVQKYLNGVGAELEFLQRGYEYHYGNRRDSDTTYRRTINTLNLPFIWHPHVNFANDHGRLYLSLGVAVSYNMSSREYYLVEGEGKVYSKKYDMKLVRDNPFGFGLQFGLGFNVIFGRWESVVEGRYYFTFGDVLRNTSKYPGDGSGPLTPRRSPVDNFNVSIGLNYRISQRPHIQQRSPAGMVKYQQRMAEKEEKKAAKAAKKKRAAGAM